MTMEEKGGELLSEARSRAGLSQVELARRAGVTQSMISAYESGARQPSLPTLYRLISATGLDLDVRVRRPSPRINRLTGPVGRRVRQLRLELRKAAAARGVTNLRVFGSVARGEDSPDSDVDLLVDVAPGVGLLGLARLQRELEGLLGAPVDLVPAENLKPDMAHSVAQEAVSL